MNKFSFKDIKVGQKYSFKKKNTNSDIKKFTEVSGDISSIHVDDNFAKKNGFKGKIFQGAYIISLFSRMIGTKLPGKNGLLLFIDTKFIQPLYPNDITIITGKVVKKHSALKCIEVFLEAKVNDKIVANAVATIKLQFS